MKPYLAGVGFATIFGLSFLFAKEALDYVDPLRLLAFRFALAALVMTALTLCGVGKVNLWGKDLRPLLRIALLQPVAYFVSETVGLRFVTSSQAGMMIALIPILVAIFSAVFLKEKTTLPQWAFILLSVSGVAVIVFMQQVREGGASLIGLLLLFCAVTAAAMFNIVSRHATGKFSPFEITFFMMWTGAIVFNAMAATSHFFAGTLADYGAVLIYPDVWIGILYLGLLSSVVAFLLVNYSLSKIPASQSAVFANVGTVVAVLAGVGLRAEPFYWYSALGVVMILTGVWGANYFGDVKSG